MDGITLSFTDARPVLAPGALEEQVRAAAPLLAEAAAGEERYRDNLGWHSVDEAAGPERVDFLLEQAARGVFDLTPGGMIHALGLDKPIFAQFCNYGHFTRANLPWEQTGQAGKFAELCAQLDHGDGGG